MTVGARMLLHSSTAIDPQKKSGRIARTDGVGDAVGTCPWPFRVNE
jgi:hypothetical protein